LNSSAIASLEFICLFAAFCAFIAAFSAGFGAFSYGSHSSIDFQHARLSSFSCAFSADSLFSNSGFGLSQGFQECFADGNAFFSSSFGKRSAASHSIPKAKISQSGSGFSLEVEGIAHYG